MKIEQEGNAISVSRPSDSKNTAQTTVQLVRFSEHGYWCFCRFRKIIRTNRCRLPCAITREKLVLNVGYSHPVEFTPEDGLEVEVPSNTKIIVKGISKERVGALASNIRDVRPPEPYKGKGIRYEGEYVRRKEGKTGK